MAAIVFLEIIKPSVRADEIVKLLPYRGPVSYGQPTGTGRIEVYFNAATVDDEAARAALERALDESGEDAREYLRVIYPDGIADADDGGTD